jgi:parallel beta-helix repeat protein
MSTRVTLFLAVVAACSSGPSGPCAAVKGTCVAFNSTSSQAQVQIAFGQAKAGTTFLFGAGTYKFNNELTVTVDNVTIQGAAMDSTILDFSPQTAGQEGILVTSNGFAMSNLTVQNTIGDGVKAVGSTGVSYRDVHVVWTNPDPKKHGAYGLYPVQSSNVLVDHCLVEGAADAGIYVGQSNHIIVRNNEVRQNVAGIEIESSQFADVHDNYAHENTGGLLVFALPNLTIPECHDVRVHDNRVINNNTDNFSTPGATVGIVPRGTGTFVVASARVEVFNNTYQNNKTANFSMIDYNDGGTPANDPNYYPYPIELYIHDNTFMGGGDDPDVSQGQLSIGGLLKVSMPKFPGMKIADIDYDGVIDQHRTGKTADNPMDICITLGSASFLNLHFDQLDLQDGFINADANAAPYACSGPTIDPITIPGVM